MIPSRRACATLFALVSLAAFAAGARCAPGGSLTDEDVVKLFVSGTPPGDIVDRIRGASVAFDLSGEMLGELRRAGLPEPVIRAMIDRQREVEAAAEPEPVAEEAAEPEAGAPLRVVLTANRESENGDGYAVRLRDDILPETRSELQLREPGSMFTGLALVLICRTPDHVPDQWRSRSPLGRDFVETPRHAMLAFVTGAERREQGAVSSLLGRLGTVPGERGALPETGVLELDLPPYVEVRLEPGVRHDLTLGVAAEAEGRYYLIAAADRSVTVPQAGLELEAALRSARGGAPGKLQVRWLTPEDPDPATEAPAK